MHKLQAVNSRFRGNDYSGLCGNTVNYLMQTKIRKQKSELHRQFILFRTVIVIVDLLAWAFFSILVFKEVGGITSILLAFLMLYIGTYISFTITTFIVDRVGYLNAYRISMVIYALVAFVFAASMYQFASVYLFLSFMRGLSMGTYWPIRHLYIVKDIHKGDRTSSINIIQSIALLLGLFVPAVAGSLISYTGGYTATFIISGVIYLMGAMYPFSYNKKTRSKVSSSEITNILRRPYMGRFLLLVLFNMGANVIIAILMTILPYIFLRSEFSVGVLASIIGVVAALMSFYEKDKSERIRNNLASTSYVAYAIVNVLFAIIWTTPLLIARSLIMPFTAALGITSRADIDATLREKILGDFRDESALEMNLIIETVFLFARIIAISFVYFILTNLAEHDEVIVRMLIALSTSLLAFYYFLFRKLNTVIKVA